MARVFTISRSYTRFAVVLYSSRPSKIFGFNRYLDQRSLLRAIGRIRYTGGGTKTGYALTYTYQRLLRYSRRKNKVLIVMTDGRSYDKVQPPASFIRRRGIRILTLGVGKRYSMRQLIQMSSNRRDVFTADFKSLGSVVKIIKRRACKGNELLTRIFKLHAAYAKKNIAKAQIKWYHCMHVISLPFVRKNNYKKL